MWSSPPLFYSVLTKFKELVSEIQKNSVPVNQYMDVIRQCDAIPSFSRGQIHASLTCKRYGETAETTTREWDDHLSTRMYGRNVIDSSANDSSVIYTLLTTQSCLKRTTRGENHTEREINRILPIFFPQYVRMFSKKYNTVFNNSLVEWNDETERLTVYFDSYSRYVINWYPILYNFIIILQLNDFWHVCFPFA